MRYGYVLGVLLILLFAGAVYAGGSTALPSYPVILSTTTTGTYGCGTQPLPCAIPIDATHPLPASTTGG